ncbi:MAG TPA: phosphatase PAP2 family protein [Thermoanaerobaculia bacterium]|nr:phosphatase PAP2 family protein [Thermoanaerobaculia bacterium]
MNSFSDPTLPVAFALPVVVFLALWAALYFVFGALEIGLRATAQRASARVVRTRLARWTVAHSGWSGLRSSTPMVLVLILGGIAAFAAGWAFIEIAEHFRLTTSSVYHADHAVNAWFQNERHPAFTALLDAATVAGGPLGMASVVILVAAGLLLRKHGASAVFVVVAAVGGALLNLALKMIFERVRPPAAAAIAVAKGYSFPSGHAMGSFVVLGSIAYVVLRQTFRWKGKSALLAMLVTAILLVGLSRVYLGVHWISDIAGGWSAGAVWLATATVAFETLLRVRQLRHGVSPPSTGADLPDEPVGARQATP